MTTRPTFSKRHSRARRKQMRAGWLRKHAERLHMQAWLRKLDAANRTFSRQFFEHMVMQVDPVPPCPELTWFDMSPLAK